MTTSNRSNPDDYTDPLKYVVRRTDFRRIPRWPNDGIEQERRNFQDGSVEHHAFDTEDPDQLALTELLGGWMFETPLEKKSKKDKDPLNGRDFILSLPWMIQTRAAKQQQTGKLSQDRAVDHLLRAYLRREPTVMSLLGSVGCRSVVHKASRDRSRFPQDMKAILAPLFREELASQKNIEILFGKVGRVLTTVLELGTYMAEPPPANSPAAAFMGPFFQARKVVTEKMCDECGVSTSDAGIERLDINQCAACKSVSYCSKECQSAAWSLHRPDCYNVQGKPVSKLHQKKAAQELARREQRVLQGQTAAQQDYEQKVKASVAAFSEEDPSMVNTSWSHDCQGKPRQADFPWSGKYIEDVAAQVIDLKQEEVLALGMFPEGISMELGYSGRGMLLCNPENQARIIILHERLFDHHGDGNLNGFALDGIFVVTEITSKGNNSKKKVAKWGRVVDPSYSPNSNRMQRFLSYLSKAKEEAQPTPDDVDLGIHNPEFLLNSVPTKFGDYSTIQTP